MCVYGLFSNPLGITVTKWNFVITCDHLCGRPCFVRKKVAKAFMEALTGLKFNHVRTRKKLDQDSD